MTTPQITVPSSMPDPLSPQPDFDAVFSAALDELLTAFGQTNTVATWINTTAGEAATSASNASTSASEADTARIAAQLAQSIAQGAANYRGEYDAGTFYEIGESVTYLGGIFIKKTTAAAGTTPVDGTDWRALSTGRVPLGAATAYYGYFDGATPTPEGCIVHSVPVAVDPATYPDLAAVLATRFSLDETYESPNSGDNYGHSVAISENYIAIGAYREAVGATSDAGRVYVITRATGAVQTIESPNVSSEGYFGRSVAITDTYLAVGAIREEDVSPSNAGRVYVFTNSGGTFGSAQTINSPNSVADGYFGGSVALTDTYLAVGADNEDPGGASNAGRAYVYTNSGGTFGSAQTFVSPNSVAEGYFGQAVAITDTHLAVGAPRENPSSTSNAGRAYVYTNSGGTFGSVQTLVSPGIQSDNYFGYSLDFNSTQLAIGEHGWDSNRGRVYVYTNSAGTFGSVQTISNPVSETSQSFGESVALTDAYLAAGVPGYSSNLGAVYVFESDGGTFGFEVRLDNPSGTSNQGFGDWAALNGSYLIVGAPSVAAYLYDDTKIVLGVVPDSKATATRVE